ncbi:MAG: FkbM family methyltransferase [Acidisphaera sp.]|nr:FkbM family methyltransferase [Acidisphaera sp.]MBV9813223.1 FkbM family methyltransferase [Acetobacteraceae bacterium]
MTADLIRSVGRQLRRYVRPLVGYWDLLAELHQIQARLHALEGIAERVERRLAAHADVSQPVLDAISRMEAALTARIEAVAAQATALTARDGMLVETVAAEIDRLDGYLLHHATSLRDRIRELDESLLGRGTSLEQRVAAELARSHESLLHRSTILEQELAAARADAAALPDRILPLVRKPPDPAYVSEGLDALIMAGPFDLLVPTQESGLLSFLLRHGPQAVEPGVRAVLQHRLKPGAVAVDIGANLGLHALTMADVVGPTGRVLCFEPAPHLAAALARTLRLNDFGSRAQVNEVALADLPGEATLYCASHSPLSSLFALPARADVVPLQVRVSTLDETISPGSRVDFVKMDVEGAEPLVWRGMRRVLSENQAVEVLMEWSASHFQRSGEDPDAFMTRILEDGFSVFEIDSTRPDAPLVPLQKAVAELEACNLLLTRDIS